jgi:hypothetical protein
MKLREEVKRKQGLAALALWKFEEVYEIEGGCSRGRTLGLRWHLDVSGPEEGCSWLGPLVDVAR